MRLYARPANFTALLFGLALSPPSPSPGLPPPATLPNGDTNAPVNVGGVMQLKNGTLGVNGLGVFGNTILVGTNGDGTNSGNSYLNFGPAHGDRSTAKSSL